MVAVTTPSPITPVGASIIFWTLRTSRPEATSSAHANATSPTTSTRLTLRPRTPIDVRPPSFNASDARVLAVMTAGTSPNSSAVAATTRSANPSSLRLIVASARRGMDAGNATIASRKSRSAAAAPAIVPAAARSRLSTNICLTKRRREAPSAARTDISRARDVARARSRPATFKQAVTSTSPTAPNNTKSAGR